MKKPNKTLTIITPIKSYENIERFIHSFKYTDDLDVVFIIPKDNRNLIQKVNLICKLHPHNLRVYSLSNSLNAGITATLRIISTKYVKIMELTEWSLEERVSTLVKKLKKVNADIVDCDWKISNKGSMISTRNSFPTIGTDIRVNEVRKNYSPQWHSLIIKHDLFLKHMTPFGRNIEQKAILPLLFFSSATSICKLDILFIRTDNSNTRVRIKDMNDSELKVMIHYLIRNLLIMEKDNSSKILIRKFENQLLFYQGTLKGTESGKLSYWKTIDYMEKNNLNLWKKVSKKWKNKLFLPRKIYY